MRHKFTLTFGYCLVSLFLVSCGGDSIKEAADQSVQQQEEAGVQNMRNDALFMAEAASANQLQIQLGEEALEKAVSPEVNGLARQMVQNHRQMQEELQAVATQANLVLPSELGRAHNKSMERVNSHSGIAFDLAYVDEIVDQQKQLIRRYEDMAKNGVSMEVKVFASKQLPLLRNHLTMAELIESSIDNV